MWQPFSKFKDMVWIPQKTQLNEWKFTFLGENIQSRMIEMMIRNFSFDWNIAKLRMHILVFHWKTSSWLCFLILWEKVAFSICLDEPELKLIFYFCTHLTFIMLQFKSYVKVREIVSLVKIPWWEKISFNKPFI